jgi:secretion/DNA translocation related TadE-like protein
MHMGGASCREERARDHEHGAGERSVTVRTTERGSAAVLVLGLIAIAIVLTLAIVAVGGAVVLAGRAESAADAAALAAADSVALGRSSGACASASSVAEIDGAHLVTCDLEPDAVEVLVELAGEHPVVLGRPVRARSRAEVDLSRSRGGEGG